MKNITSFSPFLVAFFAVSACSTGISPTTFQDDDRTIVISTSPDADVSSSLGEGGAPPVRPSLDTTQTRPNFQPPPPPPPSTTARTVEDFDTTSQQDRAAAVATTPVASEQNLGTTIASLGSPTEPGIWLKTPLVRAVSQGRIEYQGTSVAVELRPTGGAIGSASQISLAAMRLINAPLTGLPEITVYGN